MTADELEFDFFDTEPAAEETPPVEQPTPEPEPAPQPTRQDADLQRFQEQQPTPTQKDEAMRLLTETQQVFAEKENQTLAKVAAMIAVQEAKAKHPELAQYEDIIALEVQKARAEGKRFSNANEEIEEGIKRFKQRFPNAQSTQQTARMGMTLDVKPSAQPAKKKGLADVTSEDIQKMTPEQFAKFERAVMSQKYQ